MCKRDRPCSPPGPENAFARARTEYLLVVAASKGEVMSRSVLLAALLLVSSQIVAMQLVAHAEEKKMGYVDLQRALNETDDGRKAKANLKKVFDQKQKELDEQQETLKKDIEDLNKKRTLLPPDKVPAKEAERQVIYFMAID